jgi:hypothetical protein
VALSSPAICWRPAPHLAIIMKVKADAPQGTVIGKALEALTGAAGVIQMLVILQ